MHSAEETDSFFGGMAAPEWNSKDWFIEDSIGECSWLFKLECGKNKYFYLFIIRKESIFINGNALTASLLFLGWKAYFIYFKSKFCF